MSDPRNAVLRSRKCHPCNTHRVIRPRVLHSLWGSRASIVVGLLVGFVAAWLTPAGMWWLMYPGVGLLVVVGVWLLLGGDA